MLLTQPSTMAHMGHSFAPILQSGSHQHLWERRLLGDGCALAWQAVGLSLYMAWDVPVVEGGKGGVVWGCVVGVCFEYELFGGFRREM
jgi:hypothetical protein